MGKKKRGSVLFVGQCYYNHWYLSRELRKMGWRADLLNWDYSDANQMYYHGEDYRFHYRGLSDIFYQVFFYIKAIFKYDIFHFCNTDGLRFSSSISFFLKISHLHGLEIRLLKLLGKKIVYTNNGCLDGVSKSSFMKWGAEPICEICKWKDQPEVCSDEKNLAWGKFRNKMADYQCLLGGNHVDYNVDPCVHEVPEVYCLDSKFWNPELLIPSNFKLSIPDDVIKIYHAVGNFESRTGDSVINIKSTHVYLPLVKRLKKEGHNVELIFFQSVPNRDVRFYQAQADICVDMLTYGFFGANVREAMMLGKPVICYLRPEWLESMRAEIPDYVDELPIVSATPDTVYDVLKDLVENKGKREAIGKRSRDFAVKWHSSEAASVKFDKIYSELIK